MKKVLAFILALVMLLCVCSCGAKTEDKQDTKPAESEKKDDTAKKEDKKDTTPAADEPVNDTLRISFAADAGTLDPMYFNGFDIQNIMCAVYEPLWAWDNEGNQVFKLATSCDMVEPTKWVITLREGVKFTNGSDFDAEDVMFSLYQANNRTGAAPYLPLLDLDNSSIIDDHTVQLIFFDYDMTYTSTMAMLLIYDKETYDENTITSVANGTGPYKVAEYVSNSHLYLTANEDYWGEQPGIKNIQAMLITEDSQKTNGIATGTLDLSAIPFQDVEYVQGLGTYQVELNDVSETTAIYFNTSPKSVFHNNLDARQAVCMAIDRESIVDIAFNGYASVSQMPCAASNSDVTDDMKFLGVYGEGYNPEKAAQLAKSSGLEGQTISVCTDGSSASVTIAECIQNDLGAIGVNVEIKNYDSGSWYTVLFDANEAGDIMLYMVVMPDHTVASIMNCWYYYGMGGAFLMEDYPERETYEEYAAGILAISDPAELNKREVELCRIHSNAALWFGLIDKQSATAYKNELEGYRIMRMINVDYANLTWAN